MRVARIDINWNPGLPIFASDAYLKSISDEHGWLGGFLGENTVFALPYVVRRKKAFRYLQFVTATLCLDQKSFNDEQNWSLVFEHDFLNGAVEYAKQKNFDFIIQPLTNAVFNICPDNSVYTPFGTYIVDLSVDDEALWTNVSSKHRNRIRKAQKEDIKIERGKEYQDIVYKLMKQTMERSKRAFQSQGKFKRLVNSLGDNMEIFAAFRGEQLQGCATIAFSEHSACCLYAGSIENLKSGAMNLLHWEAMQYFKSLGVKSYDFVGARISPEPGSRLEGIQSFKKKFGAEMKVGYLWKVPIDQKKYSLFNLLLYIKDKGHCDIIDEEREKQHIQNNTDDV